jgi:pyridoxal phosphate enzyme (YggS family)
MKSIADNIKVVKERIAGAAERAGRTSAGIALMAVSKFHSIDEMAEAARAGIALFGESRVQEAAEKIPAFRGQFPAAEIHFIGNLQRNKVKQSLALFNCIQSIDRNELIDEIAHRLTQMNTDEPLCLCEKKFRLLLELHTAEDSKSGYPGEDALCRAAEKIAACPALELCGLMTMAPFTSDGAQVRASFRALARAQKNLAAHFPDFNLSILSMGMSGDFETAIEEGSTLVRIGTALFGERQ